MKGTPNDAFIPASVFWMVHQDDLSLFQLLVFRFSPTSQARPQRGYPLTILTSDTRPKNLRPRLERNERSGAGLWTS